MLDDDPQPSSDAPTWSIAAEPGSLPRAPGRAWKRRALLAVAVALSLSVAGFVLLMATRIPGDRSADVVIAEVHVGFHGVHGAKHWVCPDGHEHLSAPYWSGLVGLCLAAALTWWRWIEAR